MCQGINLWYAHPKTHVLLVDTDLPAGAHTNMQPYAGRGWCVMERKASGLVKDFRALISLKGLTGEETDLFDVRTNGRAAREPPMAPAAFASMLEAGVASGAIKFTNRGDVRLVATIYGKAFAAEMAAVVRLSYDDLGWDDAQGRTVIEALRAAHAGGGLRKVETLSLAGNQMGDGAAAALAALLEEGAMPNLECADPQQATRSPTTGSPRSPPRSGAARCRRARGSTSMAIRAAAPPWTRRWRRPSARRRWPGAATSRVRRLRRRGHANLLCIGEGLSVAGASGVAGGVPREPHHKYSLLTYSS